MNRTPEERKIIINGHLIVYYVYGNKNNDHTLFFLHGWRSESTLWFPILPQLNQYNVICLDLPGFGKSEMPRKALHLSNYASMVKLFIEKLGLKKVSLIGHSFGGAIAIKLASESSGLIDNLILVNSSGIRTHSWEKELKKLIAKTVKPLFTLPLMQPLRKKLYRAMGAEDYVVTPQLKNTYLNIIRDDIKPLLSTIKTRTLIVWGAKDTETPLEMGKIMYKQIPQSKLVIFPNAGHFSFLDEKVKFVDIIINFVSKASSRT